MFHKKIKNHGIFIISFVLFVLIIFFSINAILRSEAKSDRWYQFKQLPNNSLDIVFLGNSHNMQGVIPSVIEGVLGLNGFTLGVPGESIQTTYYELVEFFKTQTPSYVALETYAIEVNLHEGDGHIFAFFDGIPFSKTVFDATLSIYSLEDGFQYFSLTRQHAKLWKEPQHIFSIFKQYISIQDQNKNEFSFYLNNNGYFPNDAQITNKKIEDIQPKIDKSLSDGLDAETTFYLEKIIKLCEKENIQLILFTMPEIRYYLGIQNDSLDYKNIADSYSIPYYDLRENDYSLIHYSDTNHLTILGALRASLQLSDMMAGDFLIAKNSEIESEYQQLNIDKYTIEMIKWNRYRFNLISENDSLNRNDYSYNVVAGNQETGTRDNGDINSGVIIVYDSPGDYRLTFKIVNPNIDFQIRQSIIINLPLK